MIQPACLTHLPGILFSTPCLTHIWVQTESYFQGAFLDGSLSSPHLIRISLAEAGTGPGVVCTWGVVTWCHMAISARCLLSRHCAWGPSLPLLWCRSCLLSVVTATSASLAAPTPTHFSHESHLGVDSCLRVPGELHCSRLGPSCCLLLRFWASVSTGVISTPEGWPHLQI